MFKNFFNFRPSNNYQCNCKFQLNDWEIIKILEGEEVFCPQCKQSIKITAESLLSFLGLYPKILFIKLPRLNTSFAFDIWYMGEIRKITLESTKDSMAYTGT